MHSALANTAQSSLVSIYIDTVTVRVPSPPCALPYMYSPPIGVLDNAARFVLQTVACNPLAKL